MLRTKLQHLLPVVTLAGTFGASSAFGVTLVTTETGNGADTHLSNDSDEAQTTNHGGDDAVDVRAIQNSRARVMMIRFDLSSITSPVENVQIQLDFTTSTRTRDWVIYGLNDDGQSAATTEDNWTEGSVTYSNAPGIDLAGASANSGNYALDKGTNPGQVSTLLTWNVLQSTFSQTSPTSTALDAFINAAIANPNNKLVTLYFSYYGGQASTDSNPNWNVATKEHATLNAPTLIGDLVPEPASLGLLGLGGLALVTRRRRA